MDSPIIWAYWGHEPSYHLKRMNSKPSLFALGEWADSWQERLRSEECIKKAAEDGINVIYTNFYKGFGLEYEKEEIEKTKALVAIAHKYGIRVLGYCQLNSIYYETFLDEDPDAAQMIRRNQDGSLATWTDTYYRWSPCYNSEKFINYIKHVVDYGLDYVGLDGFHFDNSYFGECYCENCTKDFRRYLERTIPNPREVMGINSFKHVEIPRFKERPAMNYDPLYYLWQKYRQEKCTQAQNEIFKYVKEKSGDKALVLHNPAFPRKSLQYVRCGYNPEGNTSFSDFVMAENFDNLRKTDGNTITQIFAYKLAKRFGYQVFESSWRSSENEKGDVSYNAVAYPETYFQIAYYLSQSMIFGNIIGTPWLMRSTHNGSEMLQDSMFQRQTHKKVISYFKSNQALYGGQPLNCVKVLYSADNLLGMCANGFDLLKDVVNRIHNANIPFSMIVKEDIPNLDTNQIIVVPQLYFTDISVREHLNEAAKRGCKVFLIGEYDVCNIYGKARDLVDTLEYKKLFVSLQFTESWEEIIKQHAKIAVHVSCADILSEVAQDKDGNVLVHLLSTTDHPPIHFELELKGMDEFEPVSLHSYEDAQFSVTDGRLKIENFRTMATLKLEKKVHHPKHD